MYGVLTEAQVDDGPCVEEEHHAVCLCGVLCPDLILDASCHPVHQQGEEL